MIVGQGDGTITLPIELARKLLATHLGMEVTITPDDEYLLKYAQGLHAKCDELGKERDEAERMKLYWRDAWGDMRDERDDYFHKWADNQSFTERLSHERDELRLDNEKLCEIANNALAERDEAREWARHYRDERNTWRNYIELEQGLQRIANKED